MADSTEPFISLGVVIHDDDPLHAKAHHHIASVVIGSNGLTIQSSSPAALRRLAAALNDAADKAEAITEAGK